MAKFTGKVELDDGTGFEMPAVTCEECRGIGYVTRPVVFETEMMVGPDKGKKRIHRADSGDRCPLCNGRGWVGVVGGE